MKKIMSLLSKVIALLSCMMFQMINADIVSSVSSFVDSKKSDFSCVDHVQFSKRMIRSVQQLTTFCGSYTTSSVLILASSFTKTILTRQDYVLLAWMVSTQNYNMLLLQTMGIPLSQAISRTQQQPSLEVGPFKLLRIYRIINPT